MKHYNKLPPVSPESWVFFGIWVASWAAIIIAFIYNSNK